MWEGAFRKEQGSKRLPDVMTRIKPLSNVDHGSDPKHPVTGASSGHDAADGGVGDILRRAYDETLSEAVPDSMLDLLKKLN